MAAITVQLNTKDLIGRLTNLQANAPAAIARALNRSAISARAAMVPPVASDLGLKQAAARDATSIVNASPESLVATVKADVARIPLIAFNAKGPEPSRGKGRGVTARIPGGTGTYPHAFIATMPSGHRGVFQRVGKSRLKIHELRGPSFVHVFKKFSAVGLARGHEQLVKNLQSELRYAIRGTTA